MLYFFAQQDAVLLDSTSNPPKCRCNDPISGMVGDNPFTLASKIESLFLILADLIGLTGILGSFGSEGKSSNILKPSGNVISQYTPVAI